MSLLSRGQLKELTPKHFIPDGVDGYLCDNCGHISYDDKLVVDHPAKNHAVLCLECGKNWLNDNPISPALDVSPKCALGREPGAGRV